MSSTSTSSISMSSTSMSTSIITCASHSACFAWRAASCSCSDASSRFIISRADSSSLVSCSCCSLLSPSFACFEGASFSCGLGRGAPLSSSSSSLQASSLSSSESYLFSRYKGNMSIPDVTLRNMALCTRHPRCPHPSRTWGRRYSVLAQASHIKGVHAINELPCTYRGPPPACIIRSMVSVEEDSRAAVAAIISRSFSAILTAFSDTRSSAASISRAAYLAGAGGTC